MEKIPVDERRFEMAKSFSLYKKGEEDYLALDNYVDAKDEVDSWCVAKVVDVKYTPLPK